MIFTLNINATIHVVIEKQNYININYILITLSNYIGISNVILDKTGLHINLTISYGTYY